MHLSASDPTMQIQDATITAVNCSHDTWGKCIDALDGPAASASAPTHDVYYSYLSLDQFLNEAEQTHDGVVILSLDAMHYLSQREQIADSIHMLSRRPRVTVIPLCTDDEVLPLILEDLHPQVPLHLKEDSTLSDFNLVLSVLLHMGDTATGLAAIDITDWESPSTHYH